MPRKHGVRMAWSSSPMFVLIYSRSELEKNIDDPSYVPNTYLMDELVAGNEYELVISSFKGALLPVIEWVIFFAVCV